MKTNIKLELSENELRNILHGLHILHIRICDDLASLTPVTPGREDLKAYYTEKQNEVHQQMKKYNKILTT